MGRLTGLGTFAVMAGAFFLGLRVLHVAVPLFFPETKPGPFAVASLDDVQGRAGFAPLVPAYRPVALGARPVRMTVSRVPQPRFVIVWQGDRSLSLTEQRGGVLAPVPPIARPFENRAGSWWWFEDGRHHLQMRHGDLLIQLETDLPLRDLARMADTLEPYRRVPGRD